ncbi:MAG: collagen-like protein [Polyangiaceae bacterium]|nr:collagen-like protein [Polyangiaceae bacterium]
MVVALNVSASAVMAAVPATLTHQGRLFDATGQPVTNTQNIQFTLYDGPDVSAAVLWTETLSVAVEDGYFSVSLGENVPLDTVVLNGSVRWLGIAVGNDAEMTPRAPVQSVPYAIMAGDVTGAIHPTSVDIAGIGQVIDESGKWVGDPTGLVGPVGPTGPAGADGPAGPAGPVGPVGPTGPAGTSGPAGPAGPIGPTGPAGPVGPIGPTGSVGPAGPAGPVGPTGPSGVIATVNANGLGATPATNAGNTYAFLGVTAQVAVAANQSVHVVSTKAFGSTQAGGANNLRLSVCRQLSGAATILDAIGGNGSNLATSDLMDGLRVSQNTRLPFTVSSTFKGLAAGTYTFGLCGYLSAASTWDSNEWSHTTITVTTP